MDYSRLKLPPLSQYCYSPLRQKKIWRSPEAFQAFTEAQDLILKSVQFSGVDRYEIVDALRLGYVLKSDFSSERQGVTSLSFLGGNPLVSDPSDFDWPYWDASTFLTSQLDEVRRNLEQSRPDRDWNKELEDQLRKGLDKNPYPLQFIGQIALRDVPEDDDVSLSKHESGVLYFFLSTELMPDFMSPRCGGAWRVIYRENLSTSYHEIDEPTEVDTYCRTDIRFRPVCTLPAVLEWFDSANYSKEDRQLYSYIKESLLKVGETSWFHQFLGFPYEIQGDCRTSCQVARQGFSCMRELATQEEELIRFSRELSDWVLLLEVGSTCPFDSWGDTGKIYFLIRQDDFLKKDFSNVWVEFQSH